MPILDSINDILWSYIVIVMLVVCAVTFTLRTRFVQFRNLPDMLRVIFDKPRQGKAPSAFQAFAVALSSRVGTGNLAGVASAIHIGGPGAILWMWVMALLGSATAFVESTLAQLYKRRGEGSFYGGPAYYMQYGLHAKWMGIVFAILITLTFGLANQIAQSTTLCDSISDTFFLSKAGVGIVITVATLVIIFGGIRTISRFASLIVPFMAIGFVAISLFIIIKNIAQLPHVLGMIVDDAFSFRSATGGAVGVAVMQGVKRGLFSNEAGEGSAPNAAAIADTSHPVKQGLLQALGVFIDTIIICSCTAFIILLSGKHQCDKDGILLTTVALESEVGIAGRYFISIAIFLFAYSTIIANYFYGETNIRFVTTRRWAITAFRVLTGVVVMYGALVELQTAFSIVDIFMALMTITNLAAIIILFPKAQRLLRHYLSQRKQGVDPTFSNDGTYGNADDIECW